MLGLGAELFKSRALALLDELRQIVSQQETGRPLIGETERREGREERGERREERGEGRGERREERGERREGGDVFRGTCN